MNYPPSSPRFRPHLRRVRIAWNSTQITYEDLRRLLVALERLPSFDLGKLRDFSEVSFESAVKMDESLLLAFVNAGLGKNNGGFDGGAVMPTNLCKLFVKLGLVP